MTELRVDEAREVREGEELDEPRLEGYLTSHLEGARGPLEVTQFPGGHSNLTYALRLGERELVLRRPPFGTKVKSAHDMGREYRVLSRLHSVYPKAPRALLHCDDLAVLGAPFYVMERVRGVILRKQEPPEALAQPERMRALAESVVDGLAELHAVDWRAAGLADLGKPEGYVERQVRGWSERWRNARTDDIPDMDEVAGWLDSHQPREREATLVHNDFKFDNLVLDPDDPTRIVAVLDWEMATIGDPLLDLGTSLAYWSDPDDPEAMKAIPAGPTAAPGGLRRRQVVERYAARSGRDVGDVLFYYVFGLFKVAVIAQQIYFRWKQGLTQDERFAWMIVGVQVLGNTAARAIDLGRVDGLGGDAS